MEMKSLNPNARNYYFGFTNSVTRDHRKFADFDPSVGPLGASGIIREFRRRQRENNSNAWTCAIWQGNELLARGSDVRYLISEYEALREEARHAS